MSLRVRPGILSIAPYVPGDHGLPGDGPVYRMASNESALGPSPAAIAAYREMSPLLHRYPDGGARILRAAIAAHHGLDAARIVCGGGSDDLLQLLIRAYAGPGDEVLYSHYGFAVYPIAALSAGATPVAAPEVDLRTDIDALLAHVTPRTRICVIANPNNPTGSYITHKELARLREALPADILLIVDAAYAEYVDAADYADGADLVQRFDNVVMTRTFSKIYGLAALRLGWALCPEAVADVLNRIRGPFNVPAPAQAAGVAAIGDAAHIQRSRQHNDYWRSWFTGRMRELGLHPYPSVANFVLVKFPRDPALSADAAAAFLNQRRILPRKMGAYHLPECLRFTIAEEEALKAAVAALGDFVALAASQ